MSPEHQRRVQRIRTLAMLLDASIRVPGTGMKIGLDPIVGLVPVVGDTLTTLAALYIVYEGRRLGADGPTTAKMLANVAIDAVGGAIPVVGDLFDFAFKANTRNLKLLGIDVPSIEIDPAGWMGDAPPRAQAPG
jgi:hypothetical protein